jgi:hypothetical protein
MAKRDVGFVDQHIEKIATAACVLILLAAAVFSFGGFRFSANGRDPAALCEQVRDQAEIVARRITNAKPPASAGLSDDSGNPDNEPGAELQDWFGPSAPGLIEIAGIEPRPARTQRFPPLVTSISGVSPEDRRGLARMVTPSVPIVTTGRTSFDVPAKLPLEDVVGSGLGTRDTTVASHSWVSVSAVLDLIEQDANYYAEKYPSGSFPTIVKVHLQRKDRTEAWRDWENVDTYLPFETPEVPKPGDEAFEDSRLLLDQAQDDIARTRLPSRRSGDRAVLPWVPYLDTPPDVSDFGESKVGQMAASRRARKWRELAKKAMEGKTVSKTEDLDAAVMLIRAALASGASDAEIEKAEGLRQTLRKKLDKKQRSELQKAARAPERLMPLLAHDVRAVPGHTYQYRMRYEALNPYAGIPGELADPRLAERLTVFSDWSLPSRPTEVQNDVYFFLSKADARRREATVTVYKKARTGWKYKDFKIKVGSEIGRNDKRVKKADFSTGAVCVNLDFSRVFEKKKTLSLIYLDPDGGVLRERLLSVDRKDKLRRKLNGLRNGRG